MNKFIFSKNYNLSMVEYKPNDDEVVIYGGDIIGIPRAKQLKNELEEIIELHEKKEESELNEDLKSMATNRRAVELILGGEPIEDHIVRVNTAFTNINELDDSEIEDTVRRSDERNWGDFAVKEENVQDFFMDNKDILEGFHVEFDEEILSQI